MDEPTLKRENTIGITYEYGEIEEPHYAHIIERILGVPENEVLGVDSRGSTRFLFKVTTKERYQKICEKFTGRDITFYNGNVIKVDNMSSCG